MTAASERTVKLGYVVATPDCRGRRVLGFQGDLDQVCGQLAALGYEGVELLVRHPRELDHDELARTLKRHGLAVPDVGTAMLAGDGLALSDPDPARRPAALTRLREVVDLAASFGAQVHIGRFRGNIAEGAQAADAWARMREGFWEAAEYGQSRGVRVLVEPLCRYEANNILSVVEAVDFVRALGHPNLGVVADTFHMNIEDAWPPTSLIAATGYVTYVQVADSNRRYPGAGHVDFRGVLQALRLMGYDGFVTVEVEQEPDSATAARRAARTMRALLDTS